MIDTKLLRQKILDLAIRGKLVPQNPADEPASELLKKIKAEKDALVKAGKIKKDKHESCIFKGDDNRYYEQIDGKTADITDEIPFDMPDGWAWYRLISLYNFIDYRGKTPTKLTTGIPLVTAKNVKKGYICYTPADFISEAEYKDRQSRGVSKKGDLLFTTEAPLGNVALADLDEYSAGQRIITFQQYTRQNIFSNKLQLFFMLSPYFQNLLESKHTGSTVAGIKAERLKKLLLPLPPLAEQQRIVEQIETLLGYVDIIDTDAETLEKSITLAKQKILDLAIRGKLVPQDPADEPASELLKKIKAEKDALVKAGKLKKDKHESFIFKSDDNCYHENIDGKVTNITDEIPFDLPDSWTWSRIENIGVLNPRNKIEDDTEVSFMPMAQLEAGFGSKYTLSEKNWKEVKSGFTHFAENDIVFAKITPCFQNRKSAVMRGLKNGYGAGTTELHVLRSNSYLIVPEYALLFVKTQSFITDAVATIQGVVGQQRIDAGFVKHYLFPIPPLAEQKRIVSQVEKLFSVLETMRG